MKKTEAQKKLQGTSRKDRAPKKTGLEILEKLPIPDKRLFPLDTVSRRWYRFLGNLLIKSNRFTELDIPILYLLASNFSRWQWAYLEIAAKNNIKEGSGYIQVFDSGASQITPEYSLLQRSEKKILELSAKFGMTFKDRAAIAQFFEENQEQLSMWDELGFDNNLQIVG